MPALTGNNRGHQASKEKLLPRIGGLPWDDAEWDKTGEKVFFANEWIPG
jgi:hypothetical protein